MLVKTSFCRLKFHCVLPIEVLRLVVISKRRISMMTGINTDNNVKQFGNLTRLLAEKQQAQANLQAQKDAVMQQLDEQKDKVVYQQGENKTTKEQLADYVVALSNLKEPAKVEAPGDEPKQENYEIEKEDGTRVPNTERFNEVHAQWQEQKDAYEKYTKDLEDYKNQKAALEEKVTAFKAQDADNEKFLAELVQAANDKEKEWIEAGKAVDVNTGDIERINQQIEEIKEESPEISFTVKEGDKSYGDAAFRELKDLQEKGLIPKSVNLEEIAKDPEKRKALIERLTNVDKNDNVSNGKANDSYYTKMKAGESYGSYSISELNEILGSDAIDVKTDDQSFSFSMEELEKMGDEYAQKQNSQSADGQTELSGGVKLPRGIDFQGKTQDGHKLGSKISDFGLIDNGDGTYTSKNGGKTYTADEVNDWFREIENNSGNNYAKYLDKAEDLGIDYAGLSPKELKDKVKTEEKRQKSISKYDEEIKKYNIDVSNLDTADKIKEAVENAKKGKPVQINAPQHAPVINQEPVYYPGAEKDNDTNPNPNPVVSSEGGQNLNQAEIDQQVKNLKPGESYSYRHNEQSSYSNGFSSTSQTVTWTREKDGTLTKSYIGTGYQPSIVKETYDGDRIVSKKETNNADPYGNITTDYDNAGNVSSRKVDLSGLSSSQNRSSFTKERNLLTYLQRNQHSYSTQTIRSDDGTSLLTLKDGQYYKANGKPIDVNKAYDIIEKALKKGTLSGIEQIK